MIAPHHDEGRSSKLARIGQPQVEERVLKGGAREVADERDRQLEAIDIALADEE